MGRIELLSCDSAVLPGRLCIGYGLLLRDGSFGSALECDDPVRIRTDLALPCCRKQALSSMNNPAEIAAASAALAFLYGDLVPVGGGEFLP